jgi:hypothetical protein
MECGNEFLGNSVKTLGEDGAQGYHKSHDMSEQVHDHVQAMMRPESTKPLLMKSLCWNVRW